MNTNTPQILAEGLAFSEGPAFAPDGSLWLVELKGGNLCRWSEGTLSRIPVGGEPNGIIGIGIVIVEGFEAFAMEDFPLGRLEVAAEDAEGEPVEGCVGLR
jgi:sugar lactone lactonase YvrE